jgi:excisionase family DNA binding protein
VIFEASLRELLREIVLQVVQPAIREEVRAALARVVEKRPPLDGVLTVSAVAGRLGVEAATVRAWIKGGLLRAFRLPGGREYRVRASDVEEFMRASTTPLATTGEPPVAIDDEASRIVSLAQGKLVGGGK